jgi:pimeloyl-ACP methyl ester carboxylesterase
MSHVPTLAQKRDVLIYQPHGLGEFEVDEVLGSNSDVEPLSNFSLPAQAEGLVQTIDQVFPDVEKVDVAGFSLGGRIALCAAALHPDRVHHLHMTGVSLNPTTFATVSYQAWKHMLRDNNLQGVAWGSVLASYSSTYLSAQGPRLSNWVEQVCKHHTCQGLLSLLEQTHTDEWSVGNMAARLMSASDVATPKIQLCVGRDDRMASLDGVLSLAETLGLASDYPGSSIAIIDGCGHAVPMEAPRLWRQSILRFIENSDSM